MAIIDYKNANKSGKLAGTRGIRIDDKHLQIFERDPSNASIGSHPTDVIEFALYDINNNLLGWFVKDAFPLHILDAGTSQQQGSGHQLVLNPKIDIEELGFTEGLFNVSYQFLNNLFGNHIGDNKAFIHEISPSRTEVRLLPLLTGKPERDDKFIKEFNAFKYAWISIFNVLNIIDKSLAEANLDELVNRFTPSFMSEMKDRFRLTDDDIQRINNRIVASMQEQFRTRIKDENIVDLIKINQVFNAIISNILLEEIPETSNIEPDSIATNRIEDTFVTLDTLQNRLLENAVASTLTPYVPVLQYVTVINDENVNDLFQTSADIITVQTPVSTPSAPTPVVIPPVRTLPESNVQLIPIISPEPLVPSTNNTVGGITIIPGPQIRPIVIDGSASRVVNITQGVISSLPSSLLPSRFSQFAKPASTLDSSVIKFKL